MMVEGRGVGGGPLRKRSDSKKKAFILGLSYFDTLGIPNFK
jgi:hypothetical protein